jgi:hypothetical protein
VDLFFTGRWLVCKQAIPGIMMMQVLGDLGGEHEKNFQWHWLFDKGSIKAGV